MKTTNPTATMTSTSESETSNNNAEIRDIVEIEEFHNQESERLDLQQTNNKVTKEHLDDNDKKPKALQQLDGIPTNFKFYALAGIDTLKRQ